MGLSDLTASPSSEGEKKEKAFYIILVLVYYSMTASAWAKTHIMDFGNLEVVSYCQTWSAHKAITIVMLGFLCHLCYVNLLPLTCLP